MWHHNRTRYSGKVAVDVSHFRVWEKIAASNTPAIILEDDVRLTGRTWSRDLLTVLNELPEVCSVRQQQADLICTHASEVVRAHHTNTNQCE
jgi:GR25 family glycosyltransferase involved in LPS biosynthesis